MTSPEEIITCPYNKAHSIISSRMQFHLARCRVQHPYAEKTCCPFNSTHVVNKIELDVHMKLCQDRIVLDSFHYKVGLTSKPRVRSTDDKHVNFGETWDNELLTESVLENVKKDSLNKPILNPLIGAPKSERKAHRFSERLRIQRVLDEKVHVDKKSTIKKKEKEKKDTSVVSSDGSASCGVLCTDSNNNGKVHSDKNNDINDEEKEKKDTSSCDSSTSCSVLHTDSNNNGKAHPDKNNRVENKEKEKKDTSVFSSDSSISCNGLSTGNNSNGKIKGNSQGTPKGGNNKNNNVDAVAWKTQNIKTTVIQPTAFVDFPLQEKKRDPNSPWKANRKNTVCPLLYMNKEDDFPILPVCGRARGRRL